MKIEYCGNQPGVSVPATKRNWAIGDQDEVRDDIAADLIAQGSFRPAPEPKPKKEKAPKSEPDPLD